jgi:ribosome-associated heat shock protein Hsp15
MTAETIRIDLWLWHARFYKTRSLAAKAVKRSRFRINRQIVSKTSQNVRPGDVLTFPRNKEICVVEVLGIAEKRGSAPDAQTLYRNLETSDFQK